MKELVLDIAKALVDNPDAVVIEETRKNDGKHENYYARKSPDFSGDTD